MADLGGSSADEELDPAQAERSINAFIDRANALEGPAVEVLADQMAEVMHAAWRTIEEQAAGLSQNKLIAVMMFLGREARQTPADEASHWYLHAASTIVGGLIGKPAP